MTVRRQVCDNQRCPRHDKVTVTDAVRCKSCGAYLAWVLPANYVEAWQSKPGNYEPGNHEPGN